MIRLRHLLTLALAVLLVASSCGPPPATKPNSTGATTLVAEVVDGDTIKVRVGGKVEGIRIIGIDTPETVAPNEPVQCYGREASAKAKEMLAGKQVSLVADPTQGERDKYDRLLRYVELGDVDYGLAMISSGYAREYTYDKPYQRQSAYKAADAEAKSKSLGLWSPSACNGQARLPAEVRSSTATSSAIATAPAMATFGATPTTTTRIAAGPSPVVLLAMRAVPPLDKNTCPTDYPIKGNVTGGDKIYHVPTGASYKDTDPEECFATESDALATGYRQALR